MQDYRGSSADQGHGRPPKSDMPIPNYPSIVLPTLPPDGESIRRPWQYSTHTRQANDGFEVWDGKKFVARYSRPQRRCGAPAARLGRSCLLGDADYSTCDQIVVGLGPGTQRFAF